MTNTFTRKSEALDVEKVEEYISLVDKIQEQQILKASIIMDTEDIKQKCSSACILCICYCFWLMCIVWSRWFRQWWWWNWWGEYIDCAKCNLLNWCRQAIWISPHWIWTLHEFAAFSKQNTEAIMTLNSITSVPMAHPCLWHLLECVNGLLQLYVSNFWSRTQLILLVAFRWSYYIHTSKYPNFWSCQSLSLFETLQSIIIDSCFWRRHLNCLIFWYPHQFDKYCQ